MKNADNQIYAQRYANNQYRDRIEFFVPNTQKINSDKFGFFDVNEKLFVVVPGSKNYDLKEFINNFYPNSLKCPFYIFPLHNKEEGYIICSLDYFVNSNFENLDRILDSSQEIFLLNTGELEIPFLRDNLDLKIAKGFRNSFKILY